MHKTYHWNGHIFCTLSLEWYQVRSMGRYLELQSIHWRQTLSTCLKGAIWPWMMWKLTTTGALCQLECNLPLISLCFLEFYACNSVFNHAYCLFSVTFYWLNKKCVCIISFWKPIENSDLCFLFATHCAFAASILWPFFSLFALSGFYIVLFWYLEVFLFSFSNGIYCYYQDGAISFS